MPYCVNNFETYFNSYWFSYFGDSSSSTTSTSISPTTEPTALTSIMPLFCPSFDLDGYATVQPTKLLASPSHMPSASQPSFSPSKSPTMPCSTISLMSSASPTKKSVCSHLKGRHCRKKKVCEWEIFTKTCYGADELPSCSSATSQ